MLIHVDENCDGCVGRDEMTSADGGRRCFRAHDLVRSRPSLFAAADEADQTLSFVFDKVSGPDMLLLPLAVSMSNATYPSTLSFCLHEDVNGLANYSFKVVDDGGQARGGQNISKLGILQLDVHPVNQAPSFVVCCNAMVTLWTEGAAWPHPSSEDRTHILDAFAQRIQRGRANSDGSDREAFQLATFVVLGGIGTDKLFASVPTVSTEDVPGRLCVS
jgi:hypothetical protein